MTTLSKRPLTNLASAKVLKRKDLTRDLMFIWLEKPLGFTFRPGQYCTIGLEGAERPYSIVSAPHEEAIELFVELVPAGLGVLTPKLWDLRVGDSVTMRPRAKGIFTFDQRYPRQLLVSTVTGVVPYVSYLRDYVHFRREGHRFYLLHGASYKDELAYDAELRRVSLAHPNLLTYVPTVSRPKEERNDGWSGETGRVNAIVERYVDALSLSPEDTLVYACGHPGMIEDVKARMGARGFAVKEERFWKEE